MTVRKEKESPGQGPRFYTEEKSRLGAWIIDASTGGEFAATHSLGEAQVICGLLNKVNGEGQATIAAYKDVLDEGVRLLTAAFEHPRHEQFAWPVAAVQEVGVFLAVVNSITPEEIPYV